MPLEPEYHRMSSMTVNRTYDAYILYGLGKCFQVGGADGLQALIPSQVTSGIGDKDHTQDDAKHTFSVPLGC